MDKILSEDLKFWRIDRPDEWTMDRFISKAKLLEDRLETANEKIRQYEAYILNFKKAEVEKIAKHISTTIEDLL